MLSTALEAILLGSTYDAIYSNLLKANQHTNSGNQRKYFDCTANLPQLSPTTFWSNRLIKLLLYVLFVLFCTAQLHTVISMVWFQKQYKLNELDVYKSAFQRRERKEKIRFVKGVKIYSACYIFIVAAYSTFRASVLGNRHT